MTFKHDIKFDPDLYVITVRSQEGKDISIGVFDKVRVRISVEKDRDTQRGKVKMSLSSPVDSTGL